MIAKSVDIPTPDGSMDAYVACPDGNEARPLVMLFMDIGGLREELFAIARRVAAEGYCCMVPNLFHREGKFSLERRDAQGRAISFNLLPDDLQQSMRARAERLNRQTLRVDLASILDFCKGLPVRDGAAGSIGFCMGGREAFFAAQEFPDRFRATASLHGSRLMTQAEDSPHRFAARMRGAVYCGFAEFDRGSPPEVIKALTEVLQRVPGLVFRANVHPGTHHGYALPDRDVHDPAATERDWAEIFTMLRRQLAP